ncbi:MAG TPA: tRNA (adenosine(37)-N6)-threonylcarbamoyltransferase complex ATPase subunit type 1 TsaE [Candidatus Aminicenantes bacterium]|nr:tRNA (adenosine(37)-N6)-threonylcarbamoyltransferase complex ATPase subunit type 1 TsaE [Candidatus Aminicenantes bacterium]HDT14392.1 tRNA (adenosine(37)-N6)-threonylcarbamoyltransferase complex ATPase subunit type 1 TsaE [Candidatus Aminicenantes bacterium]
MSRAGAATTRSEEETFELARTMAASFEGTEVVLLTGELGAGKTVFAKGIAAGVGVADPGRVSSPSFTLVNIYEGRHRVFHVDLYRLERDDEIADLGWEDMIGRGVVVVEWAEKLSFPVDGIRVTIEAAGDDVRRVTVS